MPADVEAALADSQMTQFDSGRLTANDAVAGPREDLGRLGRRAGWKSRYRRADPAAKRGVLVVESRVDEFGDGKGAEADLAGYTSELEQVVRAQGGVLGRDVPVVGSETVTSAYQQKALGGTVHYITVVWRHGRLTASVTVSGFEGTTMDHALALARRVQRRMDEAA